MSTSTNAIAFYGYIWGEKRIDSEWSKKIAKARGHKNPWDSFIESTKEDNDAWVASHRTQLDAWYDINKAIEEEYGVSLGEHCSDGCVMRYVSAFELTAYRGCPVRLRLPFDPSWEEKLNTWLRDMKLRAPQKRPHWWLASWWG